jgi:hypothetical protein
VASWYGLPSIKGSSLICWLVMTEPVLTVPVSSVSAAAMVVTVSETPTVIVMSSVSLSATLISSPSRASVLNPWAVAFSVYLPGWSSGKL